MLSRSALLMSQEEGYTQKQILKEETEAPFRQVRLFVYAGLTAAALVGSVFTLAELAAVVSGVKRTSDMSNLQLNLGVDLGGIAVIGYFWKRDLESQQLRLQRIQRGGALAGLKLKLEGESETPEVVKLSDLRRGRGISKRVVLIVAPKELLRESVTTSMAESENLVRNDLLVVPLQIEGSGKEDFRLSLFRTDAEDSPVPVSGTSHLGVPIVLNEWAAVIKNELGVALAQQPEAMVKGFTIIIKKNGKVGARRFGVPLWSSLVADVQMREDSGLDITNI